MVRGSILVEDRVNARFLTYAIVPETLRRTKKSLINSNCSLAFKLVGNRGLVLQA